MKSVVYNYVLASVALLLLSSHTARAENYAELYESLSPSVVTIHTARVGVENGQVRQQPGLGSGVLVASDMVMTAAHVIQSVDSVMVKFKDGHVSKAEILVSVVGSDVALLKLKNPHEAPVVAKLGDSSRIRIGEPVFVIGAPFGIEHTLSVGNLSGRINRGLMASGEPIEYLQTDTAINQGNSGGPMFNDSGQVVGIVSFILSKSGGFNGIGFAVSINGAKQSLMQGSAFWTGFDSMLLTPTLAAALNVPQETGLLVQHVVGGSIVARAGLKGGGVPVTFAGNEIRLGGDIVLAIHDTVCHGPHDIGLIKDQINALNRDDDFIIKVLRAGKIIDLHVNAGETQNQELTFDF